jgi:hypothetical protein
MIGTYYKPWADQGLIIAEERIYSSSASHFADGIPAKEEIILHYLFNGYEIEKAEYDRLLKLQYFL